MTTLTINQVSKAYESKLVTREVSITFKSGEVTSLLGDNGAGKSTLLKIISGLVKQDSGAVFFNDTDISKFNIDKRREMGIEAVYQDFALFKSHNGRQNLFAQREYKNAFGLLDIFNMRLKAQNLFTELGLDLTLLEKMPSQLSGGQQQAIALARAELFNPKIILLDEPTAALGAKEVGRTLDLIKKWKMQNKILILVSHRFQDVFEVSDRILILKSGSVSSDRAVGETSVEQVVAEIVG